MKKLKDEVIGKRLRQARTDLGFSLEDVAMEVGLSSSVLDSIEKGKVEITVQQIEAVCDFLGLEVSTVIDVRNQELDSMILFREGSKCLSDEELIDRSDMILKEVFAQYELSKREGGGTFHV